MNVTFLQVLESVGKFAIGTGLLVWLIRSIVTQLLARDIEKYKGQLNATHVAEIERLKADLHAASFEHERLHEERIKVIAELYRRLVRVEGALHQVAAAELSMISEEDPDPKPIAELREALEASDSFGHYFEENRIYFDEALCTAIGTLIKRFRALWRQHALPESVHNHVVNDVAAMRPSLADLRGVIESRVRTMLGVSDESNSVRATEKIKAALLE